MNPVLRSELFKQRSTRTAVSLFASLLALVLFVVLLHGFGLTAENVDTTSEQLTVVFAWGEVMGALFAALLGAMSVTGELRHGTIRPTLLVTPWRHRVLTAKIYASMLIAAGFGLTAGAVAAGVGTAVLNARGFDVLLDAGDYVLLIGGGAAAAALWAAIGVGVGALVRNQVPALIGLTAWLLFVENLLLGDIGDVDEVGRLLPGAAAKAISGQDPDTLLAPEAGLVLLAVYAAAAAGAGRLAATRRDFA